MKGVFGILLVGGGVFLMIALFNGTLKFPIGQVNLLGLGTSGGSMGSLPANFQQPSNIKAGAAVGTAVNGKCPSGFINVNGICYTPTGVPTKGK